MALTSKKPPNSTGYRCMICYCWEVKVENAPTRQAATKITHETYCPDHRK